MKVFFKRGLSREEHIRERTEYYRNMLEPGDPLQNCPAMKYCPGCKRILNLVDFASCNHEKDGFQSKCRECSKEHYLSRRTPILVAEKECHGCKKLLPAASFTANPLEKDGLKKLCRDCQPRKLPFSDEVILKNQEKQTYFLRRKFFDAVLPEGNLKLCPGCELPKSVSEFNRNRSVADGLTLHCYAHSSAKNTTSFKSYKMQANYDLNFALSQGLIEKPDYCEDCGCSGRESKLEAHHCDYSKALDVRWLCARCHGSWHSKYGFLVLIGDKHATVEEIVKKNCANNYGYFQWGETLTHKLVTAVVDQDFLRTYSNIHSSALKKISAMDLKKPVSRRKLELIVSDDVESETGLIGTYSILHPCTGKIYYGSTADYPRRRREHIGDLSRGEDNWRLQDVVNDRPEVVFSFKATRTLAEAIELKKHLILATPQALQLNIVFNGNDGGKERLSQSKKGNTNGKNTIWTKEMRERIAARMKGNNYLLGHRHSEETRQKMSEKHKGGKHSEEHKLKSAEGRTRHRVEIDGVLYKNASYAARAVGVSYECVVKRCKSGKYPGYRRIAK